MWGVVLMYTATLVWGEDWKNLGDFALQVSLSILNLTGLSCGLFEDKNAQKQMFITDVDLWGFRKKILKDSITGVCCYF